MNRPHTSCFFIFPSSNVISSLHRSEFSRRSLHLFIKNRFGFLPQLSLMSVTLFCFGASLCPLLLLLPGPASVAYITTYTIDANKPLEDAVLCERVATSDTFAPASSFVAAARVPPPASCEAVFDAVNQTQLCSIQSGTKDFLQTNKQHLTFRSMISFCCCSLCRRMNSSRLLLASCFCFCFSSRLQTFISY